VFGFKEILNKYPTKLNSILMVSKFMLLVRNCIASEVVTASKASTKSSEEEEKYQH
jgi:hypothetical protein